MKPFEIVLPLDHLFDLTNNVAFDSDILRTCHLK